MGRRLKESALAFALVAAALAATVIALEGAVRLLLPQQLILYRPDLYREDALVGWHFVGDLDTRVNTGEPEGHRVVAELLEPRVSELLLTR